MTHHSSNGHVRAGWLNRLSGSGVGAALVLTLGLAALTPAVLPAQTGTVQGRVTQAGAGPIAGAQVTVVGTNLGTTTGEDGRFTLLVPAGQRTVRVLAIGFKVGQVQVNVTPGGSTTANAELTRSVLSLDEVVVTGTGGSATKRELGSSISSINIAAEVKDPPSNVDQMLQGRTAGLAVLQTGAAAGAGAQIRLRGVVSVNQSNQPLIYIDGIRVRSEGYARNAPTAASDFQGRGNNIQMSPLNDINPADIDRIEIIKGAAASTLYGTEASAGVIQIFTRKGQRGLRPRWNVEADGGWSVARPFGPEYNQFVNLKPRDSVYVDPATNELLTFEKRTATDGQCHQNDDLSDAFPAPNARCSWLRNGFRQKYAASVAGGFDQFQYFVSGLREDLDGILPQDNEKRLSTRGNFGFDLSEKVRVDLNTGYTNYRVRNTPSGNNAQGLILNVYRAERNYIQSNDAARLDSILNQQITTEIDRLVTGGSVYYTPVPWFSNRFTLGYDLAAQENRTLRPFGFQAQPLGRLHDEQTKFTTFTADYAGNLDYRLSGSVSGTFSVGGQTISEERVRTYAFGRDFAGPGEPTVGSAASFLADETRVRTINAGFFFQNVFKLSDKYFLTGGVRFDGNSAFGEALGLQAYPKVALSYVISDEGFWPQSFGEMKLRAAMGYAGRAPGAFDKLRTWTPVATGGIPSFLPSNVGDTLIGPEKTREIEIGADAGFFGNRLAAEVTYYQRQTQDALMDVRQVPSLGFLNDQTANVGKIESKGLEVTLNGVVLDEQKFGFELGGSVYTNSSRVLDLGGAPPFGAQSGWVQGPDTLGDGRVIYYPVAGAFGINIKNKDQVATPDTACAQGEPGYTIDAAGTRHETGDIQRCDISGRTIFGPQQPTLILGLNSSLRLPGGITLSARGEYQGGGYVNDGASGNALSRSVRWPTCARAHGIVDNYVAGGMTTSQAVGTTSSPGPAQLAMTAWERHACIAANHNFDIHVYKADMFKLRDLTLTVPVGLLIPRTESATLRVSVQNWLRWYNDDLRIFDPETGSNTSLDTQGREITEHVPPPATITMSLRLAF
jgi:TonB-linked SusC/RagA family outer membrane protein